MHYAPICHVLTNKRPEAGCTFVPCFIRKTVLLSSEGEERPLRLLSVLSGLIESLNVTTTPAPRLKVVCKNFTSIGNWSSDVECHLRLVVCGCLVSVEQGHLQRTPAKSKMESEHRQSATYIITYSILNLQNWITKNTYRSLVDHTERDGRFTGTYLLDSLRHRTALDHSCSSQNLNSTVSENE